MTNEGDRVPETRPRKIDVAAVSVPTTRRDGLTIARRDQFLDVLAETCNVSVAAAAAGASNKAFYKLRRRDPRFAEQWVSALTIGYEALEASLIDYAMDREAANTGVAQDAIGPVDGARPICQPGTGLNAMSEGVPARVQVGLLLLARHRATVEGGKAMRKGRRVVTAAETDAVLNKRLDQLARSLGQQRR